MSIELSVLARTIDRCWIEHRFEGLETHMDQQVVLVAPCGKRIEGRALAVESYRRFMSGTQVDSFTTHDYAITERGDAAVVEYDGDLVWQKDGGIFDDSGRDILVLSRRDGRWRLIWRSRILDQAGGRGP